VKIYEIRILDYNWPVLKIEVTCSSGTYIRSLANDIGEKLGCGGYLNELKRTRIVYPNNRPNKPPEYKPNNSIYPNNNRIEYPNNNRIFGANSGDKVHIRVI
jgi:hypothetical protein